VLTKEDLDLSPSLSPLSQANDDDVFDREGTNRPELFLDRVPNAPAFVVPGLVGGELGIGGGWSGIVLFSAKVSLRLPNSLRTPSMF